jgi:hypothetical protein
MMNYHDVVITNFGLARVTEALYYQQRRIMASDTFVIYPPEVSDTSDWSFFIPISVSLSVQDFHNSCGSLNTLVSKYFIEFSLIRRLCNHLD